MQEFYVMSFWASAHLYSLDIQPKRIELSPKGKRLFFYDESEHIREVLRNFYEDASFQKYVKACVSLKSDMYNYKHIPCKLRRLGKV